MQDDQPEEKDRNFVTALARGLELLRAFEADETYLGNGELSKRTGIPKPSVSRLTYTLTQLGYLIFLAGGSVLLLLLMGALTSFVLGIGMTVTAAYIFLAVALAPALTRGAGLDPMAVHLFILYWGMLSFITPPVALGAFAAATVAGARPIETGLQAMKLGSVIYFIPFLFVLNPALIMQGGALEIAVVFVQAVVGIVFFASAMQGYMIGVGRLGYGLAQEIVVRGLVLIAGLALALPGGGDLIPVTQWQLLLIAAACLLPAIGLARWGQGKHAVA